MLRKIRRQFNKAKQLRKSTPKLNSALKFEPLEQRLLLDVAGYWTELGYRSGSGGGISWDVVGNIGETEIVNTEDGDPVVFWVEGNFDNEITLDASTDPVPFSYHHSGTIHARQYAGEDIGWWDLDTGSGDTAIRNGGQISAAAGPDGKIILAGIENNEVFVMEWDGADWNDISTVAGTGTTVNTTTAVASVPSVAVNNAGEIFVSYTAEFPAAGQTDIVVMKYGYTYQDSDAGTPLQSHLGWTELISTEVGEFAQTPGQISGGISNSNGNSFDSAIAIDNSGVPIVAWTETDDEVNAEIFVKRWDGDSWEEIGENSASFNISNGNFGVSSNSYQDLQPDIVVNDDGDVIVTWVSWLNWSHYTSNGDAAIFVKYLPGDDIDGAWRGYDFIADAENVTSDSDAGIAQGNNVPDGRAGLGWYYQPEITVDSSGNPAVTWFGWGESENHAVNRDAEDSGDRDDPFWGVFVSYYYDHDDNVATADTFEVLFEDYDENEIDWEGFTSGAHTNVQRAVAGDPDKLAWAPSVTFVGEGNNEKLVFTYVQDDRAKYNVNNDQEAYVKYWDGDSWEEFGLGAASNGNPVISEYPSTNDYRESDIAYFEFNAIATDSYDIVSAVPNYVDVNSGKLYVYNRQTGAWSTQEPDSAGADSINGIDHDADGVYGFGRVYDLKGEPEIEYSDIENGNPLLAFLDDNDGLPYVYEYSLAGGWEMVGSPLINDGAASDIPGNLGLDTDTGISVQMGPDGSILVAYVATNENGTVGDTTDDYDYIITRLYDPDTMLWEDADDGELDKTSVLEPTYYSTFDGYDFDVVGDLSDGSRDDNGNKIHITNQWQSWPREGDDETSYSVTSYDELDLATAMATNRLSVWVEPDDRDNPYRQSAMEIAFNYASDSTTSQSSANIDHQFELIDDGDIIIQFDASLDTQGKLEDGVLVDPLISKDLYLYLTIDGQVVDINPYDQPIDEANTSYPLAQTPIATLQGNQGDIASGDAPLTKNLLQMTTFKFDSTELVDVNGDPIELDGGTHQVGFIAYAIDNGKVPVVAADAELPEQNGFVRIDNVIIYQRLVNESMFVSGDTDTFNNNTVTIDNALDWGFNDNTPGVVNTGVIDGGAGRSGGVTDDALMLTITNNTIASEAELYKFYDVSEDGFIRVDFDYKIETDEDLGDLDQVELQVWIDSNNNATLDPGEQLNYDSDALSTMSSYVVTGPDGDSSWVRVSLVYSVIEDDDAVAGANIYFTGVVTDYGAGDSDIGEAVIYIDNVDVSQSLTLDDATDFDLTDNDTTTNTAGNWVFNDFTATGKVSALHVAGADGYHQMTIAAGAFKGDDVTSADYADLGYYIPASSLGGVNNSYINLDFSYRIQLDAGIGLNEYGEVQIYLVQSADAILDSSDIYTLMDYDSLYRYSSDGTNAADSGWVEIKDALVGPFDATSNYFIVFRGSVDGNTGTTTAAPANISVDDVSVKYAGYSQWESDEMLGGNTGDNDEVGPQLPDGSYTYQDIFRGDMHLGLVNSSTGTQSQMLTIPDYEQAYTGDARITFRYQWDQGMSIGSQDIRLLVDGVEYDSSNINRLFGDSFAGTTHWWNNNPNDVNYTFVEIDITGLEAGTHDISIELVGAGDLWIDNLLVQGTTSLVDSINPIVKLGAVGEDGGLPFIVGATYVANGMEIYPTEDPTIYGKYPVQNYIDYEATSDKDPEPRNFVADAYHYASLYVLNGNEWDRYGDHMMATVSLNFLGVPGSSTVVPSAEYYYLQDFTAGPNQLQWILIEHATTDMVDPNGDGNYRFDAHPWNSANPPAYWGPRTSLTTEVWRWDIEDADDNDRDQWVVVADPMPQFATENRDEIFRDGQIISGPNQMPIVAWTDYDGWGYISDSHAVRYAGNDTWEAVGSSASGNIQQEDANGDNWGSTILHQMIRDENGSPLVTYAALHLHAYAVREFVTELEDPDATYVDLDDNQGDLVLDYGVVDGGRVAERFMVRNDGNGDLYIQSIAFGGLGDAQSAFNITNDPGIGSEALILKSGETYVFNVEFDPNGVPVGNYQGVIVVQTNEGESEIHPFDNFQELIVRVEVANDGDVVVEDDQGNRTDRYMFFDDAIVNRNSNAWQEQVITVRNEGTDTLDVSDLIYTGAGFEIIDILKNGIVDLDTNDDGLLDSLQTLAVDETIEITVAFNPKEALLYDETFYVVTNDTSEPVVPVRMLGFGLTGGDVTIETSTDGIEWTLVWLSNDPDGLLADIDQSLDLGSTVWGQTDDSPLMVRINNSGSDDLLVEEIRLQSGTSEVAFSPDSLITDIEIAAGASYTFEMTYSPNTDNVQDIRTDLMYLSESLFILTDSSDEDDAEIALAVEGYAVPEAPVVQIIDPDTGDILSGWNPVAGIIVDASQGLDTGTLNLGTGSIGSNSFTKTLWIKNLGGAALSVDAMQIGYLTGGDNLSDYVITPANLPGNIVDDFVVAGGGTTFPIQITYSPETTGDKSGLFRLDYSWDWNNDGTDNNPQVFIELFSEVTDQAVVISDDDGKNNSILDFGSVGNGHSKEANVIITNNGTSDLTISNWELFIIDANDNLVPVALDDPYSVVSFEAAFAIGGGASQMIPVTFAPDALGNFDAVLRIYSDDASQTDNGDDTYYTDYTISGAGVAPGVVATWQTTTDDVVDTLDFGIVEYGEIWSDGNDFRKYFRVVNDGESVIDITRIYTANNLFTVYVDGVNGGLSSIEDTDDVSLEPGEYVTVGVAFSAQQPFFDTDVVGLQYVTIEYDDNSGSDLRTATMALDAGVLMSSSSDNGSGSNNNLVWTDEAGRSITIDLSGPGSFTVKAVSTTNNDIGIIEMTGTTTDSVLKITGPKLDEGQFNVVVGAILGPNGVAIEALGAIYMKNVDLDGDQGPDLNGEDPEVVGDGVADRAYAIAIDTLGNKLQLGDIIGQADIYIGSVEKSSGMDLLTGEISAGSDIYIDGNVKSFTVKANDDNANASEEDFEILADSIEITGDLKSFNLKTISDNISTDFTVGGDFGKMNLKKATEFNGSIYTGGDFGTFSLQNGTFAGSIIADNIKNVSVDKFEQGNIAAQSEIGTVKVNTDMTDAFIIAGVNVGDDHTVGGADDSLVGGSEIKKVIVKGKFSDSSILAGIGKNSSNNYDVFGADIPLDSASGSIGSIKFGWVEFGGTLDEFGIAAGTSFKSLKTAFTENGSSSTYKSDDLPFSYNLDSTVAGDEFFIKLF